MTTFTRATRRLCRRKQPPLRHRQLVLVPLFVFFFIPSLVNALWKKNEFAATKDRQDTQKFLVNQKNAQNNQAKTYRRAGRPNIRGRFGLPSRRRKKQGLSAVLFPGVSPEEFTKGEEIPVLVDLVESRKSIPYEYYDLPACPGPTVSSASRLRKNLGAKLQGHNLHPSPYLLKTLIDVPCTALCSVQIQKRQLLLLRRLIDRQYRIHMSLDSLPVVVRSRERPDVVLRGFPVGFKAPEDVSGTGNTEYFLYNHVRFVISYRQDSESFEGVRIVGFEVQPVSMAHKFKEGSSQVSDVADAEIDTCGDVDPLENNLDTVLNIQQREIDELEVIYSYEVEWVESDTDWADRWDVYMAGSTVRDSFHFFSLVNSLVILFFLTGTVAIIVVRTLRKDISRYNELEGSVADEDESGWMLLHGDVFRPPSDRPSLLCAAVGTGAQLGTAVMWTILLSLFGCLTPMKKGQMLTTIILLYILSGSVAGYCSSRLYKYSDAKAWKRNIVLTSSAFPGVLAGMFLVLDVFLSFAGAATSVGIWTILALFLLWMCVSTPLVFVGSYLGYRAKKLEVPTKTNQIARVVPDETGFFVVPPYSILLGGLVPFGSICVELHFIMGTMWLHQIYYVMGFLLAVLLVVVASCAEMSIIMCYVQLCSEDHRWWWRSFLNAAGAGFWLFVYSVWFLSTNLKLVGLLPTLVYLTYMAMMSMALSLFCGSIGFFSTFWFTKKIYGVLKVD